MLPCFTFYAKSKKPIKAVKQHLPFTTTAKDISDRLVNLGFYKILSFHSGDYEEC
jgi:hypothetical protein